MDLVVGIGNLLMAVQSHAPSAVIWNRSSYRTKSYWLEAVQLIPNCVYGVTLTLLLEQVISDDVSMSSDKRIAEQSFHCQVEKSPSSRRFKVCLLLFHAIIFWSNLV